MKREDYDRLLSLAERGDLEGKERVAFVELAESLVDAPGGVHAALPGLIQAAARLGDDDAEAAHYIREAIRLLRRMS